MRQEVLGHDARNFFEVVQHGQTSVLLALVFRGAKPTEIIAQVQSHGGVVDSTEGFVR